MWKKMSEYNMYEVSQNGKVRRIGSKKELTATIGNSGYQMVHLCINGIRTKVLLHRLIAKTFIPNPLNKKEVNHIDGNKLNNRVENLEWATSKENIQHSWKKLNRRNSQAKYVLNMITGIYYDTIKEAAETTGYSYQSIRHKLSGRWSNNTSLIIV